MEQPDVVIYSDGSYYPPLNLGSYAASIYYADNAQHIYGREVGASCARMEITAAKIGLINVPVTCNIHLYSDNRYVVNGINDWMYKWKTNEWKNKNGIIQHVDLWQELYQLCTEVHTVKAFWVPSHSGIVPNEVVDSLCILARTL